MRLFVAVNFPGPVRERAWRACSPLREADLPVKWVGPDRLHLTLEFLGETDRERLPELRSALDGAARPFGPMELRLRGVGAFPSLRAARVVWLGVEGPPALDALHGAVGEAVSELGFERDERDFHPHVTLGRVRRKRGSGGSERLAEAAKRVELDAACRVESVELVESVLHPEGARYSVVSSHPFDAGT